MGAAATHTPSAPPGPPDCLRIRLPDFGTLEVSQEEDRILFRSGSGRLLDFPDHPLLRQPGSLEVRPSRRGDAVLLARSAGDAVFLFDPALARFRALPIGDRIPGSQQLEIIALDELFLVITENGILAVDRRGRELWRIDEVTYCWHFEGAEQGCLWFSDASGNLLGYDARDGQPGV
jgi:hypothetical protein